MDLHIDRQPNSTTKEMRDWTGPRWPKPGACQDLCWGDGGAELPGQELSSGWWPSIEKGGDNFT